MMPISPTASWTRYVASSPRSASSRSSLRPAPTSIAARPRPPQQIARELGVGYLLVGKVRWAGAPGSGRKVQVVAELVDGKTGATTWQQVFDADVTDVFSMQTAMATRVAGALGAALGSNEQQQLATRPDSQRRGLRRLPQGPGDHEQQCGSPA